MGSIIVSPSAPSLSSAAAPTVPPPLLLLVALNLRQQWQRERLRSDSTRVVNHEQHNNAPERSDEVACNMMQLRFD